MRGSTVSRSDRFLFWMAEGNRSALLPVLETSAPLRATTGVHSHARAHGNPPRRRALRRLSAWGLGRWDRVGWTEAGVRRKDGSGIGDKRRDGKVKWRLQGAVDVRDLIEIGLGRHFLLNALDLACPTAHPRLLNGHQHPRPSRPDQRYSSIVYFPAPRSHFSPLVTESVCGFVAICTTLFRLRIRWSRYWWDDACAFLSLLWCLPSFFSQQFPRLHPFSV